MAGGSEPRHRPWVYLHLEQNQLKLPTDWHPCSWGWILDVCIPWLWAFSQRRWRLYIRYVYHRSSLKMESHRVPKWWTGGKTDSHDLLLWDDVNMAERSGEYHYSWIHLPMEWNRSILSTYRCLAARKILLDVHLLQLHTIATNDLSSRSSRTNK